MRTTTTSRCRSTCTPSRAAGARIVSLGDARRRDRSAPVGNRHGERRRDAGGADLRRRSRMGLRGLRPSGAGLAAQLRERACRISARRKRAAHNPSLSATSFVIASPEARRVMETTFDAEYTYLRPGVARRRLVGAGDRHRPHRHRQPQLGSPASGARNGRALAAGARRLHAGDEQRGRRCADPRRDGATSTRAPAAAPRRFSRTRSVIATISWLEDLPARAKARAWACAPHSRPNPRSSTAVESVWRLPRFTCGHHWRSPEALAAILTGR